VKPENLTRHLRKVHPGESAESHISKGQGRKAKAQGGVRRREGAVFAGIAMVIVAIIVIAIVYRGQPDSMVGEEAPSFSIVDVRTRTHYTVPTSFHGELVFLEFFSPSCGACIDFIQIMVQLTQSFGSDDVNFISIDVRAGDTDAILLSFLAEHPDAKWTHALDTSNMASAYNVGGTPKLFIIDLIEEPVSGVVKYDHVGTDTYSNIASILNDLLGK
jgi:thiol-disulfide isomerase/thioredoxin